MVMFRSLEQDAEKSKLAAQVGDTIMPTLTASYSGMSALKNSDVLTAVSIVASDVSRFPIAVVDNTTGQYVHLDQVQYLLNTKVTKNMDAYHWRFAMVVNAILTGNSVSQIIRDPKTGEPMDIKLYLPSETFINTIDPNNPVYEMSPDGMSEVIKLRPEDVIHFKFMSTNGIVGRSPLLSLGQELDMQRSGINTLTKFFKSGMQSGMIKMLGSRLDREARRKAREDFEYAQADAQAGSPIVLDSTMDYKPLEIDTNVLNLINSNNFSTAQIAKALRVPGYKLGVNSPNQSVKQLNDDYFSSDLPFYFVPMIAEFQLKLLDDVQRHEYKLEFDTRSVTAPAITDVIQMINNNTISGNEARVKLNMLPRTDIPEMDNIYGTLNTVDIKQKAEYQSKQAEKGGQSNGQSGTTPIDNKV